MIFDELSLQVAAWALGLLVSLATAPVHRNTTDFNLGWLFHYGDVTDAGAATFADSTWRSLKVPHDWAIEDPSPPRPPFSSSAATTGYGAYVSSGISWYRKHFSLVGTDSADEVLIEFDRVMQDASFYVNGKSIATHPYGYTGVQYDITSAMSFSGDNVVSVKTDTSKQPDERFYNSAGVYRSVRLVTTNAVHIDQFGIYGSSSEVSTNSATVKVATISSTTAAH